MSVVEDVRQVLQDFLAPELRGIRGQLTSLDKRLDTIEELNRVRFEATVQRLEQIQQSFVFDKRISNLEDDQPPDIGRWVQKIRCLLQARQFAGSDDRDIPLPARSLHHQNFPAIRYAVQESRQILPERSNCMPA